ncbi:hypothetical protein HMPREF1497_0580 [Fusobacterium sp. CM21]|uniref:Uncharacterized protein n=1 Tax=Fusobacterium vincentii TaxID=155615 RepID=A0AAJ1FMT1_FUSVC|nr:MULTISPECIES: hypothetical protein [Fusobacterium]ETT04742.1 hypothetical protein HMPREF1497_0580 [Fusobacterium sp. CM21]ERT45794.1 hypothetical protein HMPREF1768_01102 [Fusobacterium nucleatum CTI-7]MCW0263196.1 hypothetical protein [Fusobacterium vincentii]MDH2314755.1 hypothetical protein [Fusobacterium nucleatum]OHU81130.1 hypothetical protein BKN39_09450 [Fusobacterium nucleatum]
MKVNKRFLIFFGLLLVTNIIHYSQTNLEILLDKIISDGSIGLIFFILYSFSGTRHQCQVEKFASFLDVYIRRENYIKSNKISDFDEKLKSFNQDLEKEFKIVSLYIVNQKFKRKLYAYVANWNKTDSDKLIELIREETVII